MKKNILEQLDTILEERQSSSPEVSYVAQLNHAGIEKILKKLAEENLEITLAAVELQQQPQDCQKQCALVSEVCDYWFHSLVLLHRHGLSAVDVLQILAERFGISGLDRGK